MSWDHLNNGPFRLQEWMLACQRFKAFIKDNRKKIEGKANGAKKAEDLRDLEFELEVAFLLLQDNRFEVVKYEEIDRTKRHPDYEFRFNKDTCINVEVKRIRGVTVRQRKEHPAPIPYTQKEFRKFGDDICVGCRQSVPFMINALIIASDSDNMEDLDLITAVDEIDDRVNEKDDVFFRGKGFNGTGDFLEYWRHLSGAVFLSSWVKLGITPYRNELWCNPLAISPIPETIQECLRNIRKTRGLMPREERSDDL
ncbi:MAG: hypothetical protein WC880_04970 [Candidatus Paceibacterota bacterium]